MVVKEVVLSATASRGRRRAVNDVVKRILYVGYRSDVCSECIACVYRQRANDATEIEEAMESGDFKI